ncbi:MAG: pre-peptidase C-terminal domain-containing protein, partial [Chloroflexi bacterium]|nr:pre-peptidase C-terminal domain-containing protein [Chloroflexota bacterium]
SRGFPVYYFGPTEGIPQPAAPLPSPDTRLKPDLAATDGGANTFFGSFTGGVWRFFGTSAAAPHAAAVAALLKQRTNQLGYTLNQGAAESILESSAATIANGSQQATGAGLVNALNVINASTSLIKTVYLPIVLKASSGSCTSSGDSNNIADALTICSGQAVSGQVNDPTDLDDVFKLFVSANQTLTISMNGSGGDADLYLYPPGTTDIYVDPFVDSSANNGNTEFIQGTVLTAGFWYIDVYAYSGTTNYNVTATISSASSTEVKTFTLTGAARNRNDDKNK